MPSAYLFPLTDRHPMSQAIVNFRLSKSLTQRGLAELSGIPHRTIAHLEMYTPMQQPSPSDFVVCCLCRVGLDLSPWVKVPTKAFHAILKDTKAEILDKIDLLQKQMDEYKLLLKKVERKEKQCHRSLALEVCTQDAPVQI